MICPSCDKEMIWRDESYIRCSCGMALIDDDSPANTLLGAWDDGEIDQLEKTLESYGDKDFTFFKGKHIITAWQEGMTPDQIVVVDTFKDLLNVLQ